MNQNLTNLAIHLASVYANTPVSLKTLEEISKINFSYEASRYEIITAIDEVIQRNRYSESTTHFIVGVDIFVVDSVGFQLKFVADTNKTTKNEEMNENEPSSDKLKAFIKKLKESHPDMTLNVSGPYSFDDIEDIDEVVEKNDNELILAQLHILENAFSLVRSIESHAITGGVQQPHGFVSPINFKSALTKYIPAITKYYIDPYLNFEENE